MNINGTMKKLQAAVLQYGLVITINRSQFYSRTQERFVPVIVLSTKVHTYSKKKDKWIDVEYEIMRTCSQADALLCMVDIYKAVSK